MAKLPPLQKIVAENYPKLDWLPPIAAVLNVFMENVVRALNNGLTFAENANAVVRTVRIDGTYPVSFKWPRTEAPVAAWVGQAREVSGDHTTRTAACDVDWEFTSAGQFKINKVTGIDTSSVAFNVTIIAVTG